MDDNFGEWVESMGVAHNINFPYSSCISSFFSTASLLLCSVLKCVFVLVYVICVQYIANVIQRTFEIIQKIEITRI